MANEVKLEVYNIRIRPLGDTSNYLRVDEFLEGNDFLSFFENYIKSFDKQLSIDDSQKKSLKLLPEKLVIASDDRIISGIIESGDYGYESKIYDINTGFEKYAKGVNDTEIKPFYFLIYLPRDEDKGFVIIQRLGIYGINNIFRSHLTKFFKEAYSDLFLEFNPFVSQKLAQSFIKDGSVREFTLTRYNLPTDITDRLGLVGQNEEVMSLEIKIVARKNRSLSLNNKISKFVNNPNAKMFDIKELRDIGFDGQHQSKVKIELNGNTRTIDLSDTCQIRPYYDIDSDVEKDSTGHPKFESIDSIAKKFINDLKEELKHV